MTLIPLRRGSCPSLALSVWQKRLADGTVAIPLILIGSHASLIRGIGVLALAAATVRSPRVSISGGLCASAREPIFAWESAPRLTAPDIYFS